MSDRYNTTELCVIAWLTAGALYSLYACVFLPPEQHVSVVLMNWAKKRPIIAAVIGGVIDHWFWSAE